eukprot:75629-Chlamydomonas_euryale.AAC.1
MPRPALPRMLVAAAPLPCASRLGVDGLTMLDHGAPTTPILAYASDHPVAMAPITGIGNVRTSAPIRPLPSAALWK